MKAVAVTPDGQQALSASWDQTLKVWNLRTGALVVGFQGDAPREGCVVAPDGRTIVAGDESGHVHILRVEGAGA